MRRTVIERSHRTTLRLVGTGEGENGSVYSPFGPVRAGLTTTPRTDKEVPLTELLSSLEKKIAELNIKSYEVLNIFLSGTTHRAEPIIFFSSTNIIEDTCNDCGNDLVAEGQSKCLDCLEKAMLVSKS